MGSQSLGFHFGCFETKSTFTSTTSGREESTANFRTLSFRGDLSRDGHKGVAPRALGPPATWRPRAMVRRSRWSGAIASRCSSGTSGPRSASVARLEIFCTGRGTTSSCRSRTGRCTSAGASWRRTASRGWLTRARSPARSCPRLSSTCGAPRTPRRGT